MNKYRVIIYDDSKGANPSKVEFLYSTDTKEEAKAKGESFALVLFPYGLISVSVEFRKEN